jgi:hypothetical protein
MGIYKKMVKEESILGYLHNNIKAVNDSKIFAGLMIITLNIASKFVTIKLSKTMESYLRHTFSRDILVFTITWMGTRDIYIALFITTVFIIFMDFLFHESSMFCVLPESFMDYHLSIAQDEKIVTPEEIKNAEEILEKAKQQKTENKSKTAQYQAFMSYQNT